MRRQRTTSWDATPGSAYVLRPMLPAPRTGVRQPIRRPRVENRTASNALFPAFYANDQLVWPSLGADPVSPDEIAQTAAAQDAVIQADAQYATAAQGVITQQTSYKKEMLRAVARVTAVQMAISVALLFIPVIGEVVAALYALVNLIVGDIMKRKLKRVMDGIKSDILNYQKARQDEVHAAEDVMTNALWPEAAKLAVSNQPLEGLGFVGDFWSNIKDGTKKAVKQVVKAVVTVHTVPVKIIGQQTIKAVRSFASAVHDTNLASKLKGKEDAWGNEMDRSVEHTTAALTNLNTAIEDAKRAVRIVTGEEQVRVASEKGALLKQKVFAQLDAYRNDVLATMQTPEYQQTLLVNLAKGIRGDPQMLESARYFQEQEALAAAKAGLPTGTVVQTVPASSSGGILAAAAAVGAFFLFKPK